MEDQGFLTGQMLIAMPGIGDPRFERALVLVCAHDRDHAMGLAVNRPVEGLTVPDLLRQLDITQANKAPADLVMVGGPVERERGFVLHTNDYLAADDNSLSVGEGLALTATREALEAMTGSRPGPRRSLLALGYAGWGGGQLEQEIRNNVWLTCEADETLIFGGDHSAKWARALAKLGVDAGLLTAEAGRA
ncbi:MAG TPA: YqgE/AlgH family protein [Phenylobacterium sp.]|nr:YqgE/AlgH family protein [Phenylobacterium sp.]